LLSASFCNISLIVEGRDIDRFFAATGNQI